MADSQAKIMTPSIVISDTTKNNNSAGVEPNISSRYSATVQATNSNRLRRRSPMSMASPSSATTPFERNLSSQRQQQQQQAISKTTKTTTTLTTANTTRSFNMLDRPQQQRLPRESSPISQLDMAVVEDLGRQANVSRSSIINTTTDRHHLINNNNYSNQNNNNNNNVEDNLIRIEHSNNIVDLEEFIVEGNSLVTTISTIVVQSGQSRIVLTILKDGKELQLRIQDMRPGIFNIGSNYKECIKYYEEQQKLIKNLRKLKKTPIDEWIDKFNYIENIEKELNKMNKERKLVYMCMLENLQTSWKSLLNQLGKRTNVLEESCKFYESCEQLLLLLDRAENHVQVFRQEFLNGPLAENNLNQFNQAFNELKLMNENILKQYTFAKTKQKQLIQLICLIGTQNLNDSRVNLLINDAQQLIDYIETYLEPLERRKIQLENVLKTTTTTSITNNNNNFLTNENRISNNNGQPVGGGTRIGKQTTTTTKVLANNFKSNTISSTNGTTNRPTSSITSSFIREISNFNDLNLVENWLNLKIDQLNSSLLSSLGVSVSDSRSILNKHEQIALECGAIQDATTNFNGKNIHAIKQLDSKDDKFSGDKSLFEQQKSLAIKTRDVITILDARIVLLKRTIDFYIHSKESTMDIGKMMRRLQVDNSLQSVQFVSNELEFKDVSSVVASGATILSELQQLQLAQQHGQRSRIVNLNLITIGIRSIIDQLNQDLAHLKTVLNQRRLILLNEDTTKMLNNFTQKCQQLHLWLNNQAKTFLITNNRIVIVESLPYTMQQVRLYCDSHDQLRIGLQNKTLEVEALLRSLPTLIENFDSKSKTSNEIQQLTDELRFDWIMVTNCFDKRSEFAKKYLSILQLVNSLDRELKTLKQFNISGRPTTPDERTDDEIRSNIDQIFIQLTNQVKNFNIDAQKIANNSTELIYSDDLDGKNKKVNDINKQQVVDYVNNLLNNFTQKYKQESLPQSKQMNNNNNNNQKGIEISAVEKKSDNVDDNQEVDLIENNNSNKTASGKKVVRQKRLAGNMKQPIPKSTSMTSTTTTSTTTTTTTTSTTIDASKQQQTRISNLENKPPAHQRPQQIDPPRFTRILQDKTIEPFSQVELECETDEQASLNDLKIEWFMNNFKKIPPSIKHSIVSEKNHHKLIIHNFSSICCGTYLVRASNSAGQVMSQCRLKLSGIKEVDSLVNNFNNKQNNNNNNNNNRREEVTNFQSQPYNLLSPSPATSAVNSTSSFSRWQSTTHSPAMTNNTNDKSSSMYRIIQGVESPVVAASVGGNINNNNNNISLQTIRTGSCDSGASGSTMNEIGFVRNNNNNNNKPLSMSQQRLDKFPITQTTYSGSPLLLQNDSNNNNNNQLARVSYIDSPISSTTLSRSVSKSPFEGTPQPPVFMHGLTDTMPHCQNKAGLVCLVMGNPPPTIEWLHNNQTIATTKCPKRTENDGIARGSICKLTIETMNPRTQGQYVCKASNRIGQTSTGINLAK